MPSLAVLLVMRLGVEAFSFQLSAISQMERAAIKHNGVCGQGIDRRKKRELPVA